MDSRSISLFIETAAEAPFLKMTSFFEAGFHWKAVFRTVFKERDGLPCVFLDLDEFLAVSSSCKGDSCASASSSAGPSDPVDIVFPAHRQIKVDDMADGQNVDASRRH